MNEEQQKLLADFIEKQLNMNEQITNLIKEMAARILVLESQMKHVRRVL